MGRYNGKLNRLQTLLPDGLLVDARWLTAQGYSRQLRAKYVAAGWLESPCRGVYRRPSAAPVHWQHVVASLQFAMQRPPAIGGRTALELSGYEHYLSLGDLRQVTLYGESTLPLWPNALVGPLFVHRNAHRLFPAPSTPAGAAQLRTAAHSGSDALRSGPDHLVWRRLDNGLGVVMSSAERAALEMLEELPNRLSFHEADMYMGSLTALHPKRVSALLTTCASVKAKRLFLWFAERHEHQWFDQLDLENVNLGSGKRSLVGGGKLDAKYGITVPATLDDEAGL